MTLDLTPGITETPQYKAWKFPGGEIHFQLKEEAMEVIQDEEENNYLELRGGILIKTRLTDAESILFFAIVAEAVNKDFPPPFHHILAEINYMPYQQADRDFKEGECFSLKTICNILNNLPVLAYKIFDPHSDVSPALLKAAIVEDNAEFIEHVLDHLSSMKNIDKEDDEQLWTPQNNLTILSPDAGAYKKIFKLCEKIKFVGSIETANKYRDTSNGELQVRLSAEDFKGRDILIIDDICMGGRTFVELAKQIREYSINYGHIYLAISHGIFSVPLGASDGLAKWFDGIFTTDSFRSDYTTIEQTIYDQPNNGSQTEAETCFLNIFNLE